MGRVGGARVSGRNASRVLRTVVLRIGRRGVHSRRRVPRVGWSAHENGLGPDAGADRLDWRRLLRPTDGLLKILTLPEQDNGSIYDLEVSEADLSGSLSKRVTVATDLEGVTVVPDGRTAIVRHARPNGEGPWTIDVLDLATWKV